MSPLGARPTRLAPGECAGVGPEPEGWRLIMARRGMSLPEPGRRGSDGASAGTQPLPKSTREGVWERNQCNPKMYNQPAYVKHFGRQRGASQS